MNAVRHNHLKGNRSDAEDAAQEPVATPEESTAAPSDVAGAAPEDELAALRRRVAELEDKNLRILAESRNAQQRAQRDKEDALKYAEANFARELLAVLDGLEHAQQSVANGGDVQAVAEGVRIVYEQFLKVLRSRRIEPIDALARPFDPSYHEAVLQQPSDQAAGTVIQEVARGYKMHERVLRASRVVVSSGPPEQTGKTGQETEKN